MPRVSNEGRYLLWSGHSQGFQSLTVIPDEGPTVTVKLYGEPRKVAREGRFVFSMENETKTITLYGDDGSEAKLTNQPPAS